MVARVQLNEPAKKAGTFQKGHRLSQVQDHSNRKSNRYKDRMITAAIEEELLNSIIDQDTGKMQKKLKMLAKKLVANALEGDPKASTTAIREIMDRMEGKAKQQIEHSGDPKRPLQMIHKGMPLTEKARIYNDFVRGDGKY